MAGGRKRKGKDAIETSESKKSKADESEAASSSGEEAGPSSGPTNKGIHVHPKRIREMRGGAIKKGPVIYW